MHILYRMRQFWHAVAVKVDPNELADARELLNTAQWELFERLQPGEKRHALAMLERLAGQGESQSDLLVATLLHDVGKLRYPLNPLERTVVVLAGALMPGLVRNRGSLSPDGFESLPRWRKAFVVSEQHAGWGADLARISGVTPLTETLIREHHHPHALSADSGESRLLHKLWVADNKS